MCNMYPYLHLPRTCVQGDLRVCIHVCIYVCIDLRVCMYVCMYVFKVIYVYVCM